MTRIQSVQLEWKLSQRPKQREPKADWVFQNNPCFHKCLYTWLVLDFMHRNSMIERRVPVLLSTEYTYMIHKNTYIWYIRNEYPNTFYWSSFKGDGETYTSIFCGLPFTDRRTLKVTQWLTAQRCQKPMFITNLTRIVSHLLTIIVKILSY